MNLRSTEGGAEISIWRRSITASGPAWGGPAIEVRLELAEVNAFLTDGDVLRVVVDGLGRHYVHPAVVLSEPGSVRGVRGFDVEMAPTGIWKFAWRLAVTAAHVQMDAMRLADAMDGARVAEIAASMAALGELGKAAESAASATP